LEGFDALYLMTTAFKGAIGILGWSIALLFVMQMTIALMISQLLFEAYLANDSHPVQHRQEVYEYFGTFSRAMLSMFEMTLANWPPVCRLLSERVSEWFMLFCILHKITIGFAVIGVINGIFMQETFKVASTDDIIMTRQKLRAHRLHSEKMSRLFEEADENGDGKLSLDEFRNVLESRSVRAWLSSMELEIGDVDTLFSLIDDGDGGITVEELIDGAGRLRGFSKSLDLSYATREITKLQSSSMYQMMKLQDTIDLHFASPQYSNGEGKEQAKEEDKIVFTKEDRPVMERLLTL
jgi:hypothetical protein